MHSACRLRLTRQTIAARPEFQELAESEKIGFLASFGWSPDAIGPLMPVLKVAFASKLP